ncbi:acyltransferase [Ponticaulis sp.]|uniref:acyltransferase family protein n=1 Tax=Ponticaulis sp. TaxID=2020902 RepID=UPI0025FAE7E9|nr:acyltransferase [Ponticaulis sp.]
MTAARQRFDSLTGLRFLLAVWIAYFHVGHMYDHDGFGALPYLELGVARVDVFFVLSGFVLTHIYWSNRQRPFAFGEFMVARIARIYPLYLLSLGMILGYLVLGALIGREGVFDGYTPAGLVANLTMTQSVGFPGVTSWNFPAWAISAEFAGYLLFPFFIWVATRMSKYRVLFFGLCILNVFVVDQLHGYFLGRELSSSTIAWGALRGAVVMLAGVGARVAFEDFNVSSFRAGIYAVLGAVCALLAAVNHIGTVFVALGGSLMIMGLARIDAHGKSTTLSRPSMCVLGNWSYAIFILHVPIYIIMKNGLDILGIGLEVNALTSLAFTLVVVAVSWPVHRLIEEPCRKVIRNGFEGRRRQKVAPQDASAPSA